MADHTYHKIFVKTEVEDVEENFHYDGDNISSENNESCMREMDTNLADQFEPGIKQEDQNEELQIEIDEETLDEIDNNLIDIKVEPGIKQEDQNEVLQFAVECKNEMKEEPLDEIEYNFNDIKVEPEPVYSMQAYDHQRKELLLSNICKFEMEEETNDESPLRNTDARFIHIEEVNTNMTDDQRTSNVNLRPVIKSAENSKKIKKNLNLKFECDECDFKTSVKNNLRQHKLSKHSNLKSFKCDKCPFQTTLKGTLLRHAYVHTDERPFKCDQCDYSGKFKDMLRRHQLTHNKNKKFKCDKCFYRTYRQLLLRKHQLTHKVRYDYSNEISFKCDKCPFQTKLRSILRQHAYVHTDLRPFKCDQCDYSGKYKSALQHHQLIHNKDKTFKCDKCPYRTYRPFLLRNHQFTHEHRARYDYSNEISFKCDKCPFQTKVKSTLILHEYVHTDGRPFDKGDSVGKFEAALDKITNTKSKTTKYSCKESSTAPGSGSKETGNTSKVWALEEYQRIPTHKR